jgi:hypothetical protein
MTQEQFDRERQYCASMAVMREMLGMGILSAKEYRQIETILAGKYRPSIGRFLFENP